MKPTQIEGLTRAELDARESHDFAPVGTVAQVCDAATLIILDRCANEYRVLLGRRRRDLAFMAGKLVFPGGRTEPLDGEVEGILGLDPAEEVKLRATISGGTATTARAIAASAIREACEEVGVFIGCAGPFRCSHPGWAQFATHGVRPSLVSLRFIARAITPPGRIRRFDTRFFATWRDNAALELPSETLLNGELEDLVWLSIADAKRANVPTITRSVLTDIEQRLYADPDLSSHPNIPFYHMVHDKIHRDII